MTPMISRLCSFFAIGALEGLGQWNMTCRLDWRLSFYSLIRTRRTLKKVVTITRMLEAGASSRGPLDALDMN